MENVIATLTIKDAAGLSDKVTQDLIEWLENHKKTLADPNRRNNLASGYRARYILTGEK